MPISCQGKNSISPKAVVVRSVLGSRPHYVLPISCCSLCRRARLPSVSSGGQSTLSQDGLSTGKQAVKTGILLQVRIPPQADNTINNNSSRKVTNGSSFGDVCKPIRLFCDTLVTFNIRALKSLSKFIILQGIFYLHDYSSWQWVKSVSYKTQFIRARAECASDDTLVIIAYETRLKS